MLVLQTPEAVSGFYVGAGDSKSDPVLLPTKPHLPSPRNEIFFDSSLAAYTFLAAHTLTVGCVICEM